MPAPLSSQSAATVRYSDRPPPLTTRLLGLAGTTCVFLILVAAGLLRWADAPHSVMSTTSAMTLVEIASPQALSAPPSERQPAPQSAERKTTPQKPISRAVPFLKVPSLKLRTSAPAVTRATTSPPKLSNISAALATTNAVGALPAVRASVPESRAVPPAPKAPDERAQWTGLVLAALHRAKHYPQSAKRMKQEGTCWIRFIIDRRGRVRSAHLQRSSGVESLDREALELPTRAQPLPRPPKGVTGHRIELIVPIEFFLL